MNSIERLRHLPDHARVWIYVADRSLDENELQRLVEHLDAFCTGWRSHGRPVSSAATVIEGRFAVIAGEILDGDISGCGIDASVHALDRAAEELDIRWLPALAVHFRQEDGTIRSVSRPEFRKLVHAGKINSATSVFDVSIQTLGELRNDKFEQPAGSTWHDRAFRLSASAV
jgi:hypothetical protein